LRIAYGVHGYGRGHATRAQAVLPKLMQHHKLLVFAGGDAFEALSPQYPVLRIPTLTYAYGKNKKFSARLTVQQNASTVLDFMLAGRILHGVMQALKDFGADIVVSDSEAFTHRAAARLRIPRISFDHFGLLVYCKPDMSAQDRVICWGNALAYRSMFGTPDRAVVTSFFEAPPRRDGICVVGPVIREEVRQVEPSRGNYLLAYFSKAEHEYTPLIENALTKADCPVRVYGPPPRSPYKNLEFKPVRNLPFIEDLAGCRAVIGTTGNQLLGEVIYFGKPMLGIPIQCLEQRLNADQLGRLGIGMSADRNEITPALIDDFLAREDDYTRRLPKGRDGASEAVEAITRFAVELIRS